MGHFGPYGGTVRTMGLDTPVLKSEVSSGHFGTGAECPDTSDPPGQCRSVSVPICPGSEVSGYRSPCVQSCRQSSVKYLQVNRLLSWLMKTYSVII